MGMKILVTNAILTSKEKINTNRNQFYETNCILKIEKKNRHTHTYTEKKAILN